jgi:hypothetical protein
MLFLAHFSETALSREIRGTYGIRENVLCLTPTAIFPEPSYRPIVAPAIRANQ